MQREYVKELRGDKRKEAIDLYHHIDKEELKSLPNLYTKVGNIIIKNPIFKKNNIANAYNEDSFSSIL